MAQQEPPAEVRIEQCEKHGLRYNAAVDSGCARCKTESGELAVGVRGFAPPPPPATGPSLMVTALLVAAVGGSLFAAHWVAYKAGETFFEEAADWDEELDAEDYEEEFNKLIDRD